MGEAIKLFGVVTNEAKVQAFERLVSDLEQGHKIYDGQELAEKIALIREIHSHLSEQDQNEVQRNVEKLEELVAAELPVAAAIQGKTLYELSGILEDDGLAPELRLRMAKRLVLLDGQDRYLVEKAVHSVGNFLPALETSGPRQEVYNTIVDVAKKSPWQVNDIDRILADDVLWDQKLEHLKNWYLHQQPTEELLRSVLDKSFAYRESLNSRQRVKSGLTNEVEVDFLKFEDEVLQDYLQIPRQMMRAVIEGKRRDTNKDTSDMSREEISALYMPLNLDPTLIAREPYDEVPVLERLVWMQDYVAFSPPLERAEACEYFLDILTKDHWARAANYSDVRDFLEQHAQPMLASSKNHASGIISMQRIIRNAPATCLEELAEAESLSVDEKQKVGERMQRLPDQYLEITNMSSLDPRDVKLHQELQDYTPLGTLDYLAETPLPDDVPRVFESSRSPLDVPIEHIPGQEYLTGDQHLAEAVAASIDEYTDPSFLPEDESPYLLINPRRQRCVITKLPSAGNLQDWDQVQVTDEYTKFTLGTDLVAEEYIRESNVTRTLTNKGLLLARETEVNGIRREEYFANGEPTREVYTRIADFVDYKRIGSLWEHFRIWRPTVKRISETATFPAGIDAMDEELSEYWLEQMIALQKPKKVRQLCEASLFEPPLAKSLMVGYSSMNENLEAKVDSSDFMSFSVDDSSLSHPNLFVVKGSPGLIDLATATPLPIQRTLPPKQESDNEDYAETSKNHRATAFFWYAAATVFTTLCLASGALAYVLATDPAETREAPVVPMETPSYDPTNPEPIAHIPVMDFEVEDNLETNNEVQEVENVSPAEEPSLRCATLLTDVSLLKPGATHRQEYLDQCFDKTTMNSWRVIDENKAAGVPGRFYMLSAMASDFCDDSSYRGCNRQIVGRQGQVRATKGATIYIPKAFETWRTTQLEDPADCSYLLNQDNISTLKANNELRTNCTETITLEKGNRNHYSSSLARKVVGPQASPKDVHQVSTWILRASGVCGVYDSSATCYANAKKAQPGDTRFVPKNWDESWRGIK